MESRGRHSLNQVLYALRGALGKSTVVSRGAGEVGLDPGRLWCDAAAFESALDAGRPADALELYRGDLLAGFFIDDTLEFERWMEERRRGLRDQAAEAAWRLAEAKEKERNRAAAAHWGRRAAELAGGHDEAALGRLLRLLDRVGDREGALRAYGHFARRLEEELGLEPAPEIRVLANEIAAAAPPAVGPTEGSPAIGDGPSRPSAAAGLLPAFGTRLVGRDDELERIAAHLSDPACRLLTLVGPGGVGKTRLAVAAAARAAPRFREAVRFVPLTHATSPDPLVSALAGALGLRFHEAAPPAEQLEVRLAGQETLLVLDDFDLLADEAARLGRILERAPGVKLLVTSRGVLNLRDEWVFPVEGLPFPRGSDAEQPARFPAVRLFVESARRARADFRLSREDREAAARICELAEGLPLAVELAAAWIRVLSCAEIRDEIERNLGFLESRLRDVPDRHRSLWATFRYSWSLLRGPEAEAFRSLSVFRGGCTREAVEEVAGASLPVLAALVDKSLLRRAGPDRYEMLEGLRQFAAERLADEPALERATGDRHCRFYVRLVARLRDELRGPAPDRALVRFGEELENIRAAWRWAVRTGALDELDAAVEGLFVFYDIRGWHREATEMFGEAALALEASSFPDEDQTGAPRVLGRLLARQGAACLRLGDLTGAEELLDRSLTMLRAEALRDEAAFVLDRRGVVAYRLGRYREAKTAEEEALALRREIGGAAAIATSLNNLGSLAYALGDYVEARKLCEEGLGLHRQLEDPQGMAVALHNMGCIALALGNTEEARVHLEKSLRVARRANAGLLMARSLCTLGNLAAARGREVEAGDRFREALSAAGKFGSTPVALEALVGLGRCLAWQGKREQAFELLAFVEEHPSAEEVHREAAARLLKALESAVAPELRRAARERAKKLDLTDATGELPSRG